MNGNADDLVHFFNIRHRLEDLFTADSFIHWLPKNCEGSRTVLERN